MTKAYLYRWTQLSTGKWYEGSRTKSGCHPDDGYICSSRIVKESIRKNPNDWNRQILVIGSSPYIRNLETARLQNLNAKQDPYSFNQHNNDLLFNRLGTTHNPKTKEKMSHTRTGRKRPDQSKFMTENNPMHSRSAAKKISDLKKQHNPMHDELVRKKLSETRRRLGLSSGDRNPSRLPEYQMTCEHCGKTMAKGQLVRWHGNNCKLNPAR